MAIKKFKPTSPALREMTVLVSDEITTNQTRKISFSFFKEELLVEMLTVK